MRKITLTNKQTFEVSRCGAADGFLWIAFPGGDIDVIRAALTPKNTQSIVHEWDGNDIVVFDGYTYLSDIARTAGGVQAVLERR